MVLLHGLFAVSAQMLQLAFITTSNGVHGLLMRLSPCRSSNERFNILLGLCFSIFFTVVIRNFPIPLRLLLPYLCHQFIRCLPAAFSREPFLTSSTSASSLSSRYAHVWLPRFLPRLFAQFCLTTSRRLQTHLPHGREDLQYTASSQSHGGEINEGLPYLQRQCLSHRPTFCKIVSLYFSMSVSSFRFHPARGVLGFLHFRRSRSLQKYTKKKKKGGERDKEMRLNEADK